MARTQSTHHWTEEIVSHLNSQPLEENTAFQAGQRGGYIQELNEKAGGGESAFVILQEWSDPWFPWEDAVGLIELFPDLAGHNTRFLGIRYNEGGLSRGLYPLEG